MTHLPRGLLAIGVLVLSGTAPLLSQRPEPAGAVALAPAVVERLKADALREVDSLETFTQQTVDMLFSMPELGFQEYDTSKYLVGLLREQGFTVTEGVAGIPTAWVATWGSGKPVIAFGSDLDSVPATSQKPGVAYRSELVAGAPGHGEGHNSGPAVNITAAIALKRIMQRDGIQGTLKLFPGIADENDGSKAYYVRAGLFSDVDICLFAHVGSTLSTRWGAPAGTGSIDVIYRFSGEGSQAAIAPWRGRSALDAVELMNIGWNFRREHLRQGSRVHYVFVDGGIMPNTVPSSASVWYYLRETTSPRMQEMWDLGITMAESAAAMAGARFEGATITGEAYPTHANRTIAETMHGNITRVGLPRWSEDDQRFARALQRELNAPEVGAATVLPPLGLPVPDEQNFGGGSGDIGAVMWTVPTAQLTYPSNIATGTAHNWANAVAMATPIAHKGATAGAKVQALTALDFLASPRLVEDAWTYFRSEQAKSPNYPYRSFLRQEDRPATWLNRPAMEQYRQELQKLYFDPARYKTYLEQLGVSYPTIREAQQ